MARKRPHSIIGIGDPSEIEGIPELMHSEAALKVLKANEALHCCSGAGCW